MKVTQKPVEIYGREYQVEVGLAIRPDGWTYSGCLLQGDDFSTFRVPCGSPIYDSLAVEVEITGHTIQLDRGSRAIRARITFVGDGEPDVGCGGWLYLKD